MQGFILNESEDCFSHSSSGKGLGEKLGLPEINHLETREGSQHPNDRLSSFQPGSDDTELCQALQILQRTDVGQEVVVEVQVSNVDGEGGKVVGKDR